MQPQVLAELRQASFTTREKGHGRKERREYTVLEDMTLPASQPGWKSLPSFVRVVSIPSGAFRVLANRPGPSQWHPNASPDGRYVVFETDFAQGVDAVQSYAVDMETWKDA